MKPQAPHPQHEGVQQPLPSGSGKAEGPAKPHAAAQRRSRPAPAAEERSHGYRSVLRCVTTIEEEV